MKAAIFAASVAKKREGGFRTPEECIGLCADAGYSVIDWSPNYDRPDWQEDVDRAVIAAERHGVTIVQSHAPYNFYRRAPIEEFDAQLGQSVDAAIRLGVKDFVFHFDEYHPAPGEPFDPDKAMETIYALFAPHIEKTISHGINAALETAIEDHIRVRQDERSHYSGIFEEVEAAIARFHDPRVTCCWDFGHAQLAYGDRHVENLTRMGKKISCLHVHDNYYGKDLHLMPYLGNLDWETLIPALKATGYDGALPFELGYACLPDALVPEFLKLTYHAMDSLCRL